MAALGSACTEKQLRTLAATIGRQLPAALERSLRIHNGVKDVPRARGPASVDGERGLVGASVLEIVKEPRRIAARASPRSRRLLAGLALASSIARACVRHDVSAQAHV